MSARWIADCGHEAVRIVTLDGVIAGGLQLLPLGTFFGGKRVPLTGVGAVVVLPEHRGRGVGKTLMREALKEMRATGVPLSGLFPATLPLYRSAGFERSGVRHLVSFDLRQIALRRGVEVDPDVSVLPLRIDDDRMHRQIRELYRRMAPSQDGHLDREEHIWRTRIYAHKCNPTRGYLFVRGSTLEGFLFLNQSSGTQGMVLDIRDLVCETQAAMVRVIQFLADHRSIAVQANWMGAPEHPVLSLLHDHCFSCRLQDAWMLRVVDVAGALQSRGYPTGFAGRFTIGVRDDLVAENNRPFAVQVSEGCAQVSPAVPGESPDFLLDVRMLAPVLSGFHSLQSLAAAGLLERSKGPAIGVAAAAFARTQGSTPWMAEIY